MGDFLASLDDDLGDATISTGDDVTDIDNTVQDETVEEEDVCKTSVLIGPPGGCLNGATCRGEIDSLTLENVAVCDCAAGYEGEKCADIIDNCAGITCGQSAECQNNIDGFYCDCPANWSGDTCDIDDFCASNPCQNGMACENAQCKCTDTANAKTSGLFCDVVEYCAFEDPCQNNGICVDADTGSVCNCVTGFYGPTCEILTSSLCDNINCGDNGLCILDEDDTQDSGYKAKCDCEYGYEGGRCGRRNACLLDRPCESVNTIEDGCVTNDDGTATCSCLPGFEGQFCQITPCDASSSFNDCDAAHSDIDKCNVDNDNRGKCPCIGDSLERDDLDCAQWGPLCNGHCGQHAVQCDVENGAAVCVCEPGWQGPLCKQAIGAYEGRICFRSEIWDCPYVLELSILTFSHSRHTFHPNSSHSIHPNSPHTIHPNTFHTNCTSRSTHV